MEIKQDRRLPVLDLLPPAKQRKIKGLLGYNPSTAGGVMSPDFVAVARDGTVANAIAAARSQDIAAEQLHTILLTDPDGTLAGTVTAGELLRADGAQLLESIAEHSPPSISAEAEIPEVARLMTDYNLVLAGGAGRRGTPDRRCLRRRHPRADAARAVAPPLRPRPRVDWDYGARTACLTKASHHGQREQIRRRRTPAK